MEALFHIGVNTHAKYDTYRQVKAGVRGFKKAYKRRGFYPRGVSIIGIDF